MNESSIRTLRLNRGEDGVGLIVFDAPGESVNTLRSDFAEEFHRIFDEIERDESLRALVLSSAKPDCFIAGADISMLERISSAELGTSLSQTGQTAVERIAQSRIPVVAAIHGACLGGGLEIALACAGRVASLSPKTRLGLPEVQLGILPGMGGTQRLPALVGLSAALDLLLSGRQVSAERAQKMGLVDEVVPYGVLTQVAIARALQLAEEKGAGRFSALRDLLHTDELRELALAENPIGRKLVFDQARKRLLEKSLGNYPAPEKILDVVRFGLERGLRAGLVREAEAFGELVVSREAASLRHLYFSGQSLKKDAGASSETRPRSVGTIGVLGAGLMGAGIAYVSSVKSGHFVRLKDVAEINIERGLGTVGKLLQKQVERRRMSARKRARHLAKITRTTDSATLRVCDVVIEAVYEDLDLKRRVLKEVEDNCSAETIFASNTSSLPISKIAEGAQYPERVIGMHYFSPVEKMPLLEVITTKKTADWVTKTCVELGRSQGKTVIVVNDGPGFYTTRILGPYLNEAAYALVEGGGVEAIDHELVQAGFPVGPLALLDEVGIDVGTHVAETLHRAFGERLAPPSELGRLLAAGRQGRKNKSGFYDYSTKTGAPRPVDLSVYSDLGLPVPRKQGPKDEGFTETSWLEPGSIAERCILQMVNEAVHCLAEGILRNPRDGDIGAIFGLGFPPFLGGPFFLADTLGAENIVMRLERLEGEFGQRFAPAPLLKDLAKSGGAFFDQEVESP